MARRPSTNADIVDQLEHELLNLKSLVKILEVVGIDPAGPEAKQIVAHMIAGAYHGIQRAPKKPPRQPARQQKGWTLVNDLKLMLDVEWCRSEYGVSGNKAISLIAEAFPAKTCRYPYKPKGRKSPKTTAQQQYEAALRRRWLEIVKPQEREREAVRVELASDDPLMAALGFGRPKK
jgi:hypothetical protein